MCVCRQSEFKQPRSSSSKTDQQCESLWAVVPSKKLPFTWLLCWCLILHWRTSVSQSTSPISFLKIWSTMGSALGTSGRTPINRHHAESWSATSGQNAPRKIHGKDRSRFLGPWRHDSQANHKKSDFRASLASKNKLKQERFTLEGVRINHVWKYALISESLFWFDRNLKALWENHLFIFLQAATEISWVLVGRVPYFYLVNHFESIRIQYYAHVSGTSCRSSHRLEPESRHKCTAWRKLGLSPVTNAWEKMVKRQENHCMPHHIKSGME